MTEETERLLFEILQYVRASAVTAVRSSARLVIDSPRKMKVYTAMKGDKTQQEIGVATGVPKATVWRYQTEFLAAGLASPPNKYSPNSKALFSLEELGLTDEGPTEEPATAAKGGAQA